ncbi:hypothetical protein JB92DRAFT_2827051 [Gautieria morchelliformis]|nr:hypothetical protein JB92DRAFT_2827051 [Gautieria morchelliformis]
MCPLHTVPDIPDGFSSEPEDTEMQTSTGFVSVPTRGSSTPLVSQHAPSSPLSILGSPLKRKCGRPAGTRKLQKQAEKSMNTEEVKEFWQSEMEQRERRQSEVWKEVLVRQQQQQQEEDKILRQVTAHASCLVKAHGSDLLHYLYQCDADGTTGSALELLTSKIKREAEVLVTMLSCQEQASLTSILESFSMDTLLNELETCAPTIMALLRKVVLTQRKKGQLEFGKSSRHNHDLDGQVLTTTCCMLAFTWNEKSSNFQPSNFQLVLGLFLLGSGGQKGSD